MDFDDDYFEDDLEDDYDEFEDDFSSDTIADTDEEPEEDHFDIEDAIWLGGAMGWAYEEGWNERRKRKKNKNSGLETGNKA